jgi:hypothetical protein
MQVTLKELQFPVFGFKEGLVRVKRGITDFQGSSRILKRWYLDLEIVDASLKRYRVKEVQIQGGVGPLWGLWRGLWEDWLLGRYVSVDLTLIPLPKEANFDEMRNKVLNYVVRNTQYSTASLKVVRAKIGETQTIAELADAMEKAFSGAWFPDFKKNRGN